MATAKAQFNKVFSELKRTGLLLEQDASFPSAVGLITGGPLRGSWWAHPLSHLIYDVLGQLGTHPDVLVSKLLSKKVTFVHRKLWPAIFAIGTARDDWQIGKLSSTAKSLLKKLDKDGELQTDVLVAVGGYESKTLSKTVNELEAALLIHSMQFHTERGKHARRLETWPHWANRVKFTGRKLPPERAKKKFEEIAAGLNSELTAKGKLPWR